MSTIELISWAYMLTNSARVLAYFPQLRTAWRCTPQNASALSSTTWAMFAVSHCTTTLYGWLVMHDLQFSAISLANFVCTTAVFLVIVRKQWLATGVSLQQITTNLLGMVRPAAARVAP